MSEFFQFPSLLVLGTGIYYRYTYYRYLLKKSLPSPIIEILPFPSKAVFTLGGYHLLNVSQVQFIREESFAVKGTFHLGVVALPILLMQGALSPGKGRFSSTG